MNNLLIKNQLIFVTLVLFLSVFSVFGISSARARVKNIHLTYETENITNPVMNYYNYRLSLAESNNQTILQSIVNPAKDEIVSAQMTESIPVLVYHGIVEKEDGRNTTLTQIKNQLYGLKDAGYKTVSLEDYILFTQGKKQLPEKSFLLTFDDGRTDSYKNVDPVLKALNYQAVMFVITSHLEENSNFYLSSSELKDMQKSNRWSIQSHGKLGHEPYYVDENKTIGNFFSNKLWLEDKNRLETTEEFKARVEKDLKESKEDLRKHGFDVQTFAFPFGDYGQFSKNFSEAQEILPFIARDNYTISFYQTYKKENDDFTTQNYFAEEKALSKRLTIKPEFKGTDIIKVIESGTTKQLPFSDGFSNQNNWIAKWGLVSVEKNALMIGSTEKTTGGAAFLKDAKDWKNYRVDAGITTLMGSNFSIHTNVKNENNFVSCNFSESQIQIAQKINGETEVLVTKKLKTPYDPAHTKFSVVMNGNDVTCLINDTDVAKTTKTKKINESLDNGTIGFSTWDKELANSAILVNSLSVSKLQ